MDTSISPRWEWRTSLESRLACEQTQAAETVLSRAQAPVKLQCAIEHYVQIVTKLKLGTPATVVLIPFCPRYIDTVRMLLTPCS